MEQWNNTGHSINSITDLIFVISTNGIVYLVSEYATPIISFFTASLSLYYIIRKVKKDFFSDN